MSDIKISIETSQTPGTNKDITIIRVDGVIDTMTATELEKVANSLLGQKRYNIIVDLGGVDYISSAGWGIFISNIREIRLNSGDIKLARMIPNVYEIFELLEFDSILKAFDNIEKAKTDFSGGGFEESERVEVMEPRPIVVGDQGSLPKRVEPEPVSKPSISLGNTKPVAKPLTDNLGNEVRQEVRQDTDDTVVMAPSRKSRRLEDALMDLVGKDPFLSVSEIRKAIVKEFPKTGFLKTWWTLRSLGLSSKKKRFYFARTRRFSK